MMLAFVMNIIITISNNVKVEVQHKVQEDKMDREELMGQELGPGEFSDDGNDFLLYSLHFLGWVHLPGVWEECLRHGKKSSVCRSLKEAEIKKRPCSIFTCCIIISYVAYLHVVYSHM